MKFSEYLTFYKKNNSFPHALMVECHGCIDYDLLIRNYLKTMLCEETLFCDQCNFCNQVNHHAYIDLMVIDCTSQQLVKEDVLNLQKNFSLASTSTKNIKLYVIINIENANKVSMNALLKFVEEPPVGTYGLFFTRNEALVLDTIKSRCQKLRITNENQIDDEMINYCFDSISQYESFKQNYDLNQEVAFINKLVKFNQIEDQIAFINKVKTLDYSALGIFINLMAYAVDVQKKVALKQLKKYLHLNLNKILLANQMLKILEN